LDLTASNNGILNMSLANLGNGATDPLAFDFDISRFTQFAGQSQLNLQSQDGFPAGALVSFAVGASGEISGIYSNGSNRIIGQLALASFVNPGGLQRAGQNLWNPSANSGDAIIGEPNTNGRGAVSTGTLETSNVDLAQQFTNVIIAQRGFQSSSRVITASDQMLQDLVNIIR
jgi:flagellar hook protein FlgE